MGISVRGGDVVDGLHKSGRGDVVDCFLTRFEISKTLTLFKIEGDVLLNLFLLFVVILSKEATVAGGRVAVRLLNIKDVFKVYRH